MCVQHSLDSRNSAIRGAYRILLRPSSILEPRHPSLKVVKKWIVSSSINKVDRRTMTDTQMALGNSLAAGESSKALDPFQPQPSEITVSFIFSSGRIS